MRILAVEDNPKLAATLRRGLQEHGFNIDVVNSGQEGEQRITTDCYDMMLLDIMLPDTDGIRVCQNIRRAGFVGPILMVSALSDSTNVINGLNSGADDYIRKPFDFDELVARIRSLFRRSDSSEATVLSYHDVAIDLSRRTVMRQGKQIHLARREFMFLEQLMRNADRVVSRAYLASQVWEFELDEYSNVMDVCVSTLRSKLDKPFEPKLIHTVVGVGYILSSEKPSV